MRLSTTIPALPVPDIATAVDFYAERFGFTALHHDGSFAVLQRDDAIIHLWEAGDHGWRSRAAADLQDSPVCSGAEDFLAGTASCRILVDDVDALYGELAAAQVMHPVDRGGPVATDFGTREFPTLDLAGNLLTFFQDT